MSSSPEFHSDTPIHARPPRRSRRRRRRWLGYAVLLAALVLWQLKPVMAGLNQMQHGLAALEAVRSAAGQALFYLYHQALSALIPLLQHLNVK